MVWLAPCVRISLPELTRMVPPVMSSVPEPVREEAENVSI